MNPKYSIKYSLDSIDSVVHDVFNLSDGKKIWLFYGDLGAGKTTFIKSLCKLLAVKDNVSSATYSIINQYLDKNNIPVYHCDFYRISTPMEAIDIGFEEILDQTKSYCFVEWPSRVECILHSECFILEIINKSDNHREILIKN